MQLDRESGRLPLLSRESNYLSLSLCFCPPPLSVSSPSLHPHICVRLQLLTSLKGCLEELFISESIVPFCIIFFSFCLSKSANNHSLKGFQVDMTKVFRIPGKDLNYFTPILNSKVPLWIVLTHSLSFLLARFASSDVSSQSIDLAIWAFARTCIIQQIAAKAADKHCALATISSGGTASVERRRLRY